MFFKKNTKIEVVIGEHSSIDGNITAEGSVCINGKVKGDIQTKGAVIISLSAIIDGNINGKSVDLHGQCNGNIMTEGSVAIYAGAHMLGDVRCESINAMAGSTFEGNIVVTPNEEIDKENDKKIAFNKSVKSKNRLPLDRPKLNDIAKYENKPNNENENRENKPDSQESENRENNEEVKSRNEDVKSRIVPKNFH